MPKILKLYNIIYIICKIKLHVLNPIESQRNVNLFILPTYIEFKTSTYTYLANVYANI